MKNRIETLLERLIQFCRRLSDTGRRTAVFILAVIIAFSTIHTLTFPATAMTRQAGEEAPGIELNEESQDDDFAGASEEPGTENESGTDTDPAAEQPQGNSEEPVAPAQSEGDADTDQDAAPADDADPEELIVSEETEESAELSAAGETGEAPAEEIEKTEESDPEADVETAADWEAMFKDIELSGIWADDLLAIAESQIGYKESTANFILDDDDVKHGYTRYGAFYGTPYAKWDSLFIVFDLFYAGIPVDAFPYSADCAKWAEALGEQDMFFETETYVPVKGDLVFADTDEDGEADHAGIIKEVKKNESGEPVDIVVLEGDMNNAVEENTYEYHNPLILGYGKLPENPDLEEAEETGVFKGSAGSVEVTVEYPADAFPEGTTMEVKEVVEDKVLDAIQETAANENREVVSVQAVDIIFRDAKGEEIQPEQLIKVTMKSIDVPREAENTPVVVHVDNENTATVVETDVPADSLNVQEAVTFESDSFSVYAIVYTIETRYRTFDGETFKITLSYGENSGISADAQLDVREILKDSEEYAQYLDSAAEELGEETENLTFARFFDIRIMENGTVIEPEGPVEVTVEYDEPVELSEEETLSVVHFGSKKTEVIRDVEVSEDGKTLNYAQSSFSVSGTIVSPLRAAAAGATSIDHISVAKDNTADISVPLAYGTYYYYDENNEVQTLTVSAAHPVFSRNYDFDVQLQTADLQYAQISANRRGSDGTLTPVENTFTITSFTEDSSHSDHAQIRMSGTFDVMDSAGEDLYYSITVSKSVNVPLQYIYTDSTGASVNAPLYAKDPSKSTVEPLRTNTAVTLSSIISYWDYENNECPAAHADMETWEAHGIVEGSGIDTVLGAKSSGSHKVYAVEITKVIVDENGNRIKPNETITNSFTIHRSDTAISDSVKDLNIGAATDVIDFSGYSQQHSDSIAIGTDGIGSIYDYDVTPGMYYVSEDPDSIPETITDTSNQTWNYKGTYFLTEYAWRNHPNDNYMHVSPTYSGEAGDAYGSVPEVLGDHPSYDGTQTFTNDFLEFYVYNVYEAPKADVPVNKTWADFAGDAYDWSATFKLQWAPVYPGEDTPSTTFEDVRPAKEITITKAQMAAGDASLSERTFTGLPLYGTDVNGNTFRYQYSLEEVEYVVRDSASGAVLYSWNENAGYNSDDEDTHYQPFYIHDAGEDSAEASDYHIDVSNARRNISAKEYIDVSLSKQWDSSFDPRDDSYWAEFELRRFVRTEYRDTSHMSDADRMADKVTVTIKDTNGNVIDSMEVLPNVGVYLAGNFAPHNSDQTITFRNDSGGADISVTAAGSNMSNALVRSAEFFVTEDTVFTLVSGTESLVAEGKKARVLDTSAGSSNHPDKSFKQTIRLDSSNNWTVDLDDLIRSETSSGEDDHNENVTIYEYYLVEKGSDPEGIATYYLADASGNPTEVELGDSDHQIEEDSTIVAVNGPSNRLVVKKYWRGVPDTTGFPHVTFTLYQAWADGNDGWVYVNPETGASYQNIEIPANTLEWVCPEELPETRMDGNRSRAVKYYVAEDVQNGSMSDGGINTSWQFYYYLAETEGKTPRQTNAGHQGYFAYITGKELEDNGGTITICNKMNSYMQLDIQKQFFKLEEAGSWNNVTATTEMQRGAVLGFKVIRAIKTADGTWLDENGNESDTPIWSDYSDEMLCGYDENGQAVLSRGENDIFWLHNAGGNWHFRIEDNQGDATSVSAGGSGLPSYGYYIRNGQEIAVEYWYAPREVNVYKDLNRTPYPEWDWFSSITPVIAKGPNGQTMDAFPKAFHGQDSMRIANFQASNLIIDKEWVGDSEKTAKEVFIKIWRTDESGNREDFTALIADDVKNNNNWQMYVDDASVIDTSRGWLIVKPDENGNWEVPVKVNRALLGSLAETGKYHYYIEEVAYRASDGTVRTNPKGRYRPVYDKWIDGHWGGAPASDGEAMAIQIGNKGENRLKVINSCEPVTSYTIKKRYGGNIGSTGNPSSVNGGFPTDGSQQVVVELQQRYRYEKTEDGVDYVSADYETWVRADSEEAVNTWTVDWQGAESADPTSVVLPLPRPADSRLTDAEWYATDDAWTYTWEGLDIVKMLAQDADPSKSRTAQLYYRAVETSTPGWVNDHITSEEQEGHKAIDDDEQTAGEIQSEQNTVTNSPDVGTLKLDKEWTGLAGDKEWPEGYVVYYQLIQNYHLALTDTSHTGPNPKYPDQQDLIYILPEYSYGPKFWSVNMVTNAADANHDRVHSQATGTLEEDNHNLTIENLPLYGFITATGPMVEQARAAGVTLEEGIRYPVVYTYSVKETRVTKDGVDVPFKEQTADFTKPQPDEEVHKYGAKLTNELVNIDVEKEWNGLQPPTPGENEKATIQLRRFAKEPDEPPVPENIQYTVTVTGEADALASGGSVTVNVYNSSDQSVGTIVLSSGNNWTHTFELTEGETYHASFAGDGTVLNTEVAPASASDITETRTDTLTAAVKPVYGSVKLVVTGEPHGLWVNALARYIDGVKQDGTEQPFSRTWFDGSGGETDVLEGLVPGGEYRFQIGAAPDSVEGGASYADGFVTFTATNDLKVITLTYNGGGGGGNTTSGTFSGAGNYWGINDWNHLTVGQTYSFTFQIGYDPAQCIVDASGVSSMSYNIIANWGGSGQITVTFVPASADEQVVITASQRTATALSLRKAGRVMSLKLNAPVTWTNSTEALPEGADVENDEVVDEVTFSGTTLTKSWSELPKYDNEGNEYVYYVYETAYEGAEGATSMTTTYTYDEENSKWIVINTPTYPESGTLRVTKTVFYDDEEDPDSEADGLSFTVGLYLDAEGTQPVMDTEGAPRTEVITVTDGAGEAVFAGLDAGMYYVFEINDEGNPVIGSGTAAVINETDYTVSYTQIEEPVAAGQESAAAVVNRKKPYDLNVVKVEKDTEIPLKDAQFKLYKLKVDPDTGEISRVAGSEQTVTTDPDGKAKFEGLAVGFYEIEETRAPKGYILTGDTTFYIKVTSSGVTLVIREEGKAPEEWQEGEETGLVTFEEETATATVGNESGSALPMTGGPGTALFNVLGGILILFAGLRLCRGIKHI